MLSIALRSSSSLSWFALTTALALTVACSKATFSSTQHEVIPSASGGNNQNSANSTATPANSKDPNNASSGPAGSSGSGTGATKTPAGSGGSSSSSPSSSSTPGSNGSGSTTNSGGTIIAAGSPCSATYAVPATANPYLAGVANGTTIDYSKFVTDNSNPIDTAPADSPVLIVPTGSNCIVAGQTLTFTVSGSITYNPKVPPTDADGNANYVVSHDPGAVDGKSNITAPMNSLLGVFLTDSDPSSEAAPAALNFSTQADRDYTSLSPLIGQVFFIGTGVTSQGAKRQIVVPGGATRLFFAVMDDYQWNNNVGTLSGAIDVN